VADERCQIYIVMGKSAPAPAVATRVIDRAIEVFGGAGVSNDTPLAYFYAWARVLRIVDGPDAVHRRSVARQELRRERPFAG
jgi:acyl-CoA dehydrogenase